jgi:5'-nucleotidase
MDAQQLSFTILHTNDLHSAFESMPKISTFFQRYASQVPPEQLLRFDIGDHMDRMRPETEGTLGGANVAVMNATGYDAVVVGNNEGLTFTPDILDELYTNQAQFPVIATNLHWVGTADNTPHWNRTSLIMERQGVRIGVIGLTAAFHLFYQELGWHVSEPLEAARTEVTRLRNVHGVDLVIVLSHLGLPMDRRLAAEVPGIHLILGGHTHHICGEIESAYGAYIGAAGKLGTHVGVVKLIVDRITKSICSAQGGAVDLHDTEPDIMIQSLIAKEAGKAGLHLKRVVAVLTEPIPVEHERESIFGNLLASALRQYCRADIGLVNAGQLLGGLDAGVVTAEQLLAVCPSPINPARMMLRGEHLWHAIQQSLEAEYIYRAIRGFGFRGYSLGTLCMDGMAVTIEKNSSDQVVLKHVTVGGHPLELMRTYSVGTIDMFTFRVGYETLAEGMHVKYFLPDFIRDLIANVLASSEQQTFIQQAKQPRSQVL